MIRLIAVLAFVVYAMPGLADEIRPGYLEITETSREHYSVLWKVPMKGDGVLRLSPLLPDSCREQMPGTNRTVAGAMIKQWSVVCSEGLADGRITIEGLQYTQTDVLVRLTHAGSTTQTIRLTPKEPHFIVSGQASTLEVMIVYLGLGFEHILIGIDHLLFVFALLLIVQGWRLLVVTITAFTVAHSMTLAAATLGYVNVPQNPVEAVIALSILFLATEIVHAQQGKIGLAQRYPWLVAFGFGLLHGFGFAGALLAVGLPASDIPIALLFFNLGVEAGQLFFVSAVLLAGYVMGRVALRQVRRTRMAMTYVIGSVAAFWTIERVAAFYA